MPSVRYFLKDQKGEKSLIFCTVSFRGMKVKVSTGQTVSVKQWNQDSQLAKTSFDFDGGSTNHFLLTKKNAILDSYRDDVTKGVIPTEEDVKLKLRALFGQIKSKNSLVTSFIGTFLSGKGKEYSPGTKSVYNTLKKHLEGYGQISRKDVTFESIGRDFYDGWTAYLIGLDMHPGTVGKYVKHLKALMHDAFDRGLHENVEYTKKYFAVTRQEPDMIYLTVEELGKMEKLKDLDDNQSFYRDIFVLSCRTGLRFSDWNKYRIEYVVGGNLTVKTKKTGQVVVIPLRETDVEVIRKWENKRLISNQNFNEMIKKVGRKAGIESMVQVNTNKGGVWKTTMIPKYELVCTHTARRSFATNAYLSGVPTDLIRRVTGHKTEKAFLRYIRIDGFKAAEELRKYDFFK